MTDRPLLNVQREMQGVWESDADGPASHYGTVAEEARAATESAAVFDWSLRRHLFLWGNDRAKFLHNFCTNDIRNLSVGTGCEAFVTTVQGKLLAWLDIFAESDRLAIAFHRGDPTRLLNHLEKYHINEDVALSDESTRFVSLYLSGPQVAERLRPLLPGCDSLAQPLRHMLGDAPWGWRLRRLDRLGVPGFELVVATECAAEAWRQIVALGVRPAGEVVYQALRIAHGIPEYGPDMSDQHLAQEIGRTTRAISFTKGCYLGQEPIARIDALGHVNQRLARLSVQEATVPPVGAEVLTVGPEERVVGHLTSTALSPLDNAPVALGFLRRGFLTEGLEVRIRVGEPTAPRFLTAHVHTAGDGK